MDEGYDRSAQSYTIYKCIISYPRISKTKPHFRIYQVSPFVAMENAALHSALPPFTYQERPLVAMENIDQHQKMSLNI